MADILKISKQAVQKRIAGELGIGKRQFKEQTLLQLSELELSVYKQCVNGKATARMSADSLGISHRQASLILRKLCRMGAVKRSKKQSK